MSKEIKKYFIKRIWLFFSEYIQEFSNNNLENYSIGKMPCIQLENLEIRKDLFINKFKLPIAIEEGKIGRFNIRVPFLFKKYSSKIQLENIEIHLRISVELSQKLGLSEEEIHWNYKQERLQQWEQQKRKDLDIASSPNWISNQLEYIFNNMEISILNFQLYYYDYSKNYTTVFKLAFEQLHIRVTDNNFNIIDFLPKTSKEIIYNQISIHQFQLKLMMINQRINFSHRKNLLKHKINSTNQFLIYPLEISGNIVRQLKFDFQHFEQGISLFKIQIDIQKTLAICLSQLQKDYLLQFPNEIEKLKQIQQYMHMRPLQPISQNPQKWWLYAIKIIIQQNRKKKTDWKTFATQVFLKNRYIQLYKRKQTIINVPWLSQITLQEERFYNRCERELSLIDLLQYRDVAFIEIQIEAGRFSQSQKDGKEITPQNNSHKLFGIKSLFQLWKNLLENENQVNNEINIKLTEKEQMNLYQFLEQDEAGILDAYLKGKYVNLEACKQQIDLIIHNQLVLILQLDYSFYKINQNFQITGQNQENNQLQSNFFNQELIQNKRRCNCQFCKEKIQEGTEQKCQTKIKLQQILYEVKNEVNQQQGITKQRRKTRKKPTNILFAEIQQKQSFEQKKGNNKDFNSQTNISEDKSDYSQHKKEVEQISSSSKESNISFQNKQEQQDILSIKIFSPIEDQSKIKQDSFLLNTQNLFYKQQQHIILIVHLINLNLQIELLFNKTLQIKNFSIYDIQIFSPLAINAVLKINKKKIKKSKLYQQALCPKKMYQYSNNVYKENDLISITQVQLKQYLRILYINIFQIALNLPIMEKILISIIKEFKYENFYNFIETAKKHLGSNSVLQGNNIKQFFGVYFDPNNKENFIHINTKIINQFVNSQSQQDLLNIIEILFIQINIKLIFDIFPVLLKFYGVLFLQQSLINSNVVLDKQNDQYLSKIQIKGKLQSKLSQQFHIISIKQLNKKEQQQKKINNLNESFMLSLNWNNLQKIFLTMEGIGEISAFIKYKQKINNNKFNLIQRNKKEIKLEKKLYKCLQKRQELKEISVLKNNQNNIRCMIDQLRIIITSQKPFYFYQPKFQIDIIKISFNSVNSLEDLLINSLSQEKIDFIEKQKYHKNYSLFVSKIQIDGIQDQNMRQNVAKVKQENKIQNSYPIFETQFSSFLSLSLSKLHPLICDIKITLNFLYFKVILKKQIFPLIEILIIVQQLFYEISSIKKKQQMKSHPISKGLVEELKYLMKDHDKQGVICKHCLLKSAKSLSIINISIGQISTQFSQYKILTDFDILDIIYNINEAFQIDQHKKGIQISIGKTNFFLSQVILTFDQGFFRNNLTLYCSSNEIKEIQYSQVQLKFLWKSQKNLLYYLEEDHFRLCNFLFKEFFNKQKIIENYDDDFNIYLALASSKYKLKSVQKLLENIDHSQIYDQNIEKHQFQINYQKKEQLSHKLLLGLKEIRVDYISYSDFTSLPAMFVNLLEFYKFLKQNICLLEPYYFKIFQFNQSEQEYQKLNQICQKNFSQSLLVKQVQKLDKYQIYTVIQKIYLTIQNQENCDIAEKQQKSYVNFSTRNIKENVYVQKSFSQNIQLSITNFEINNNLFQAIQSQEIQNLQFQFFLQLEDVLKMEIKNCQTNFKKENLTIELQKVQICEIGVQRDVFFLEKLTCQQMANNHEQLKINCDPLYIFVSGYLSRNLLGCISAIIQKYDIKCFLQFFLISALKNYIKILQQLKQELKSNNLKSQEDLNSKIQLVMEFQQLQLKLEMFAINFQTIILNDLKVEQIFYIKQKHNPEFKAVINQLRWQSYNFDKNKYFHIINSQVQPQQNFHIEIHYNDKEWSFLFQGISITLINRFIKEFQYFIDNIQINKKNLPWNLNQSDSQKKNQIQITLCFKDLIVFLPKNSQSTRGLTFKADQLIISRDLALTQAEIPFKGKFMIQDDLLIGVQQKYQMENFQCQKFTFQFSKISLYSKNKKNFIFEDINQMAKSRQIQIIILKPLDSEIIKQISRAWRFKNEIQIEFQDLEIVSELSNIFKFFKYIKSNFNEKSNLFESPPQNFSNYKLILKILNGQMSNQTVELIKSNEVELIKLTKNQQNQDNSSFSLENSSANSEIIQYLDLKEQTTKQNQDIIDIINNINILENKNKQNSFFSQLDQSQDNAESFIIKPSKEENEEIEQNDSFLIQTL